MNYSPEFSPRPETPENPLDRYSLEDLRSFFERYIVNSIDKNKIEEEEFEDVYDPRVIERDQNSVVEKQEIFQKALQGSEMTEQQREVREKLDILAKEFEAICSDHTVLARVYGLGRGEIAAQSTSDYDDIFRKTDLLLEFPRQKIDPKNKTADYTMGIDVTISKRSFEKKFEELYGRFHNDPKLNRIKYFRESAYHVPRDRESKLGEAEVPRYIVNANPEELVNLVEGWQLWRDNFNPNLPPKEIQALFKKSKLGESKIWYRIMYQLKIQSITFYKFFRESNPKLAQVYYKNYIVFVDTFEKLKLSYINSNPEWEAKHSMIKTERSEGARNAKTELLHREIHDQFHGNDMSYIKKIISNTGQ